MTDTYPRPKDGWTCFHCGERFRTTGAARDHFGHDPLASPGCLIKAGEEKGLLMELRKAEAARDLYLKQRQTAEDDLEVARGEVGAVLRAAKAGNAHEVRCNIDSLEGRVMAAEMIIGIIEKSHPGLVASARRALG